MVYGNAINTQIVEKSLITKADKINAVKKNNFEHNDDDFKKVLSTKKDEQESKDSKIKSKDSKAELKDTKVKSKTTEECDTNEDDCKDIEEESVLNELNVMITDLIQTLQSNDTIDGEELQMLTQELEKLVSSLNINNLNMNSVSDSNVLKELLSKLELVNDCELLNDEDLKNMISGKINELTQALENVDSTDTKGINNEELNTNSQELSKNDQELNTNDQSMKENIEISKEGQKQEQDKGDTSNSNDENTKQQFNGILKKNNNNIKAEIHNDMDTPVIRNVEINNANSVQSSALNTTTTASINKQQLNIFNQVLEGAKINISEDVSEMLIKLKPDNLGKMSMKIAIEKGILVARFDVESQMVKEAIESNLEDLRNALSDKGFEIKEFNVSVNKDSDNQESSFSYFGKKKSKKSLLTNSESINEMYVSNQQTINSLNSSFDYLA